MRFNLSLFKYKIGEDFHAVLCGSPLFFFGNALHILRYSGNPIIKPLWTSGIKDEVNDMDKRFFSNLWNKRSSAWTFGLCLTGVLVIASIVAVDKIQQDVDKQPETAAEQAYLGEETEDLLSEDLYGTVDSELDAAEVGNVSETIETDMGESMEAEDLSEDTDSYINEGAAEVSGTVSDEAAEEAASGAVVSEADLLAANISFDEENTLMWPAAGTIVIDYSMDGTVFFETLNQYKYNPALIIGSEVGNQVVSSAKGIVESIRTDEVTGLTMTVNIGNGYRLVYGQLKEAAAAEGDVVEAGSILGYISEPTRYYVKEGSNLYFQMTKDGAPVDPVLYLE